MIKAAALYIVIIISLLIAVVSVSLLSIAFYYRMEVQKKMRLDRLLNNVESGTAILLSTGFNTYNENKVLDLYGDQKDSVVLNKSHWGIFDVHSLKTFELKDTIKRIFFSGIDFTDQGVIYLADEDRPLSVSGSTRITGNGTLPKAGLKQAYVNGMPYDGKELIKGEVKDSERTLPLLNTSVLEMIETQFKNDAGIPFDVRDSVENSFFNPAIVYKIAPELKNISNVKIKGKIILVSDTVVTIAGDVNLQDVQIYAQAIVIKDGFKGSCQLFARDSIIIGKKCEFAYPSFAGVFKPEEGKIQSKVSLGEGSKFSGLLMGHENKRSDLQTMVSLEKNTLVNGEIYACGYIKLERSAVVYGSVSAIRFMMQTPVTLYENYLIDVIFDRTKLNRYYLSSPVFKRDQPIQNVLKWLN